MKPSCERCSTREHPWMRFAARMAWCVALVIMAAGAASAQERVVAVGDVHGDHDALVGLLQHARLIDAKLKWKGGKATLVQTGDILDRGPKPREVMDLLMALEKGAPKKGGRVVALLGNHEAMNILGDLRYVTPENYARFADKNSEKRRKTACAEYLAWREARAQALGQIVAPATPAMQTAWMEAHPLGFVEHRAAFGPAGKYGQWLRARPAVDQIGGTIFLHGGISPDLSSWKIETIRKRVADELRTFDNLQSYLSERKIILPYFTLEEMTTAVQAEQAAHKAEVARRSGEAAAQGKPYQPAPEEKQHLGALESFLGMANWLCQHPDGPLWFRGYAQGTEEEAAGGVRKVLETNAASQIVVGHTPQRDGRVHARLGGKVFFIDTGMLSSYYTGGRASALEIHSGRFTAVYLDQRVVLLERAAKPAQPAGQELDELDEVPGGGIRNTPRSGRDTQAPAAPVNNQGQPAKSPPPSEHPKNPPAAPAAKADSAEHPAAPDVSVLPPRVFMGPDGKPLPFRTDEEFMEFMRTAKIISLRDIGTGITHPRKVLLEKDGIRMNTIFRDINAEKDVARMAGGSIEMFFRDTYIFEMAAYHLARLLGLDNIPPVVERKLRGESGSMQVWIENALMQGDRLKRKIRPPDVRAWIRQEQVMKIFDNLVYNTDRNMGNILADPGWRLWMIDHTRTFRRHTSLKNPEQIIQCERRLWEKLKSFNDQEARLKLKPYLRGGEIDSLLKRRKLLVEHIQKLIDQDGEEKVLFTLETAAPSP